MDNLMHSINPLLCVQGTKDYAHSNHVQTMKGSN